MARSLLDQPSGGESAMPLSLFESAYICVRTAIGEDDWSYLTGLQRADLICCEMHRLAKVGQHDESAPDLPLPKQNSG
jgi:hypothetical protein